jgi:drug/metabolite transporter (DMT)-like permease
MIVAVSSAEAVPKNGMSDQQFGLAIALLAATLFSTKPILIKWLYSQGVDVLPLIWLRMAIALPFYLIVGWMSWKRLPQPPAMLDMCKAFAIGLLGYYLSSMLDLYGLQYVSAQLERLVLYAYPSIVVILGILFFGQPFKIRILPPLLVTYLGLALMYGHDLHALGNTTAAADVSKGTLLVMSAAFTFALYLLLSKQGIRQLGSFLFTSVAMSSATLGILLQSFFSAETGKLAETLLPDYSMTIWAGILALSLVATVLPSFLVSEAIRRIGPERTSMSGTLGPVATTLLAVIFLDESLTLYSIGGMALVVFGVWSLSRVK